MNPARGIFWPGTTSAVGSHNTNDHSKVVIGENSWNCIALAATFLFSNISYTVDSICTCGSVLSYLQVSLLLCPKITEASARYFCGAKKLHTEPRKISAHLSVGPLGLSRIESDWAASSNQSQKGSRRRVPPGSWSISVHISCFSRFNLWSTLTPEEFDVKTLISWLASPLAHWDSNCPIETWHKSFLSTFKTC